MYITNIYHSQKCKYKQIYIHDKKVFYFLFFPYISTTFIIFATT